MLVTLSEVLSTPVSALLGETLPETPAEDLRAISEKLEVINLQLSHRKDARRRALRGLCIAVCAAVAVIFAILAALGSPYLGWDLTDPETAVMETAVHAFEWLFVRLAPFLFLGAAAGIFLTRKKD